MWDQDEAKPELAGTRRIDEELTETGAVLSTTTWEHDATGRVTSRVEVLWTGDVKVDLQWRTFYDPQGRIIGKEVTDGSDVLLGQELWRYRPDGLKGEWEQYDKEHRLAASNLFMYQDGRLVNVTATDEISGRTFFKDQSYDAQGQLVESVTSDAGRTFKHTYEHDAGGRLVQMWHFRDDIRDFGERYRYEGALLVRVEELDADGEIVALRTYRYDDQNRPVEELKLEPDGETVRYGKRSRYKPI